MSKADKQTANPRGRPATTEAQKAHMRDQIARVAKRLFRDEGYSKVSMRRIAGEIGCSPMTLYKYYHAKIDVLRTLWADVMSELFDQLEAETPGAGPDLNHLALAYVQFWLDHTDYYRLVFMAEGVSQLEVSLFVGDPDLAQRFDLFAQAICAKCAEPPSADALKEKLDALICFLNGIAHNLITISGYPWSTPKKMTDLAVRAVTD